jgi:hypothetical protein
MYSSTMTRRWQLQRALTLLLSAPPDDAPCDNIQACRSTCTSPT